MYGFGFLLGIAILTCVIIIIITTILYCYGKGTWHILCLVFMTTCNVMF